MMHDIVTSVLGTGHPNFKEDQIQPGDYFLKRKLGFYSDILILKFTQESIQALVVLLESPTGDNDEDSNLKPITWGRQWGQKFPCLDPLLTACV